MLKTNKLCFFVRYYGKRVMNSDSTKSLRISPQNREPIPRKTLRNFYGSEKLSQSSIDANNSVQVTGNAGKKKTEDDCFRELIDSIRNRTTREKLGLTYICGSGLIRNAIGKGVLLPEIYFHDSIALQALPHQSLIDVGVQFIPVSKESFTKHLNAEMRGTEGILAVFAIPGHQRLSKKPSHKPLPLTVICDNIRDPGNMAKIIQSSVAVRCDRVLVTKGCVDVWEPKVLQMGRGAHFDISIETNLDWKEIDEALPKDCSIYLADSSPHLDGRDVSDDKNDRNNESNSRQYRGFEYDCIDYCNDHSVVVIGGETNGISSAAFDMFSRMRKRPGCRIHVPMMSGIDSLNSAIASSIILFEIGRQMKLHSHKQ